MDEFRRIRFLYPPIILFAALTWALKPGQILAVLARKDLNWPEVFVGGGAVVVVSGYVIGTVSILFLHIVTRGKTDVPMSKDNVETLWREWRRKEEEALGAKDEMCVVASFDHAVLPERLASWLDRRWNAYNTSAHTVTALILGVCPRIAL